MVNLRRLEKGSVANERVQLAFYKVLEKNGKKMMKPLPELKTDVPIAIIKAVLDNTITESFYDRLARDLLARGIETGTTVQLRAVFSKSNAMVDPAFKGTHVLCEVKV